MKVQIRYLTVGKWKENAYLVQSGNEGWLIDPGDNFEALDSFFQPEDIQLKGILNTHGHFDHIAAVAEFKEKYKIPFFIHSKDKGLVRQGNLYRKLAGDETTFKTPVVDGFLDEDSLVLNDLPFKVHYTPGHTHGSVCFEIGDNLISGDLLFRDTVGRTDLPGGNEALIYKSVNYVLTRFRDYTLYPGHGEPFVLDSQVTEDLKKKFKWE